MLKTKFKRTWFYCEKMEHFERAIFIPNQKNPGINLLNQKLKLSGNFINYVYSYTVLILNSTEQKTNVSCKT